MVHLEFMSLEVFAMSDVWIFKVNAQYLRVSDPVGLSCLSYVCMYFIYGLLCLQKSLLFYVLELSTMDR